MEQNMRFGLILGWLAILKKQLVAKKQFKKKKYRVGPKKLHSISYIFSLNLFWHKNQLCLALLETNMYHVDQNDTT